MKRIFRAIVSFFKRIFKGRTPKVCCGDKIVRVEVVEDTTILKPSPCHRHYLYFDKSLQRMIRKPGSLVATK
jgi:hypothetical protein